MSAKRIFCVFTIFIGVSSPTCYRSYGSEYCAYVPAPPGEDPSCAKDGFTYCEHPYGYPSQIIEGLVQRWKYDHKTLIQSESQQEYKKKEYPAYYGTDSYFPQSSIRPDYSSQPQQTFHAGHLSHSFHSGHQGGIGQHGDSFHSGNAAHSSQPVHTPHSHPSQADHKIRSSGFPGYQYLPPANRTFFEQYKQPNTGYYPKYFGNVQTQEPLLPHGGNIPNFGPQNYWKRLPASVYKKYQIRRRRAALNHYFEKHIQNVTSSVRNKRQAESQTLCTSTPNFILPRAALNVKGNWMYIVNMPELNRDVAQLVRTETCVSQQCSGICSLPAGFTSKCEQRYVQKRLVALQGSGNELATDLFWLPSCCICTISNN